MSTPPHKWRVALLGAVVAVALANVVALSFVVARGGYGRGDLGPFLIWSSPLLAALAFLFRAASGVATGWPTTRTLVLGLLSGVIGLGWGYEMSVTFTYLGSFGFPVPICWTIGAVGGAGFTGWCLHGKRGSIVVGSVLLASACAGMGLLYVRGNVPRSELLVRFHDGTPTIDAERFDSEVLCLPAKDSSGCKLADGIGGTARADERDAPRWRVSFLPSASEAQKESFLQRAWAFASVAQITWVSSVGPERAAPRPLEPEPEMIPEALGPTLAQQFPLHGTEDDPIDHRHARDALGEAGDFRFVLSQGGGLSGYDTLVIDASGKAAILFHPRHRERENRSAWWRQITFQLSGEQIMALKGEIAKERIFDLKKAYRADVFDGTQWIVRVRAGRDQKLVSCDNHFPREVIALSNFVRALLPPIPVDRRDVGVALTEDQVFQIEKGWE